jgi:hypothetical protein
MEIIGIVILNYVFGFFGATLRFILINLKNLLFSKPFIGFNRIWSDKKTSDGKYDNYLLNVVLGAILFFLFATLVITFNW